MNAALELPLAVGAALLASAEGYTLRATQLIEAARERLGTLQEVAGALAENLPQPKLTSGRVVLEASQAEEAAEREPAATAAERAGKDGAGRGEARRRCPRGSAEAEALSEAQGEAEAVAG